MLNKQKVKKDFTRHAGEYDRYATVQTRVRELLYAFLPAKATQILDVGCGTGHALVYFSSRYPHASLTGLDISSEMIAQAQQHLPHTASWLCADMETYMHPFATYDLIFSNVALQWCDPDTVIHNIAHALTGNGSFVFSILVQGTFIELHQLFQAFFPEHRGHVHQFYTEDILMSSLKKTGMRVITKEQKTLYQPYRSVRELLAQLKHIGAQSAGKEVNAFALGPKKFAAFLDAYDARLRTDGFIQVPYKILMIHAQKHS